MNDTALPLSEESKEHALKDPQLKGVVGGLQTPLYPADDEFQPIDPDMFGPIDVPGHGKPDPNRAA